MCARAAAGISRSTRTFRLARPVNDRGNEATSFAAGRVSGCASAGVECEVLGAVTVEAASVDLSSLRGMVKSPGRHVSIEQMNEAVGQGAARR